MVSSQRVRPVSCPFVSLPAFVRPVPARPLCWKDRERSGGRAARRPPPGLYRAGRCQSPGRTSAGLAPFPPGHRRAEPSGAEPGPGRALGARSRGQAAAALRWGLRAPRSPHNDSGSAPTRGPRAPPGGGVAEKSSSSAPGAAAATSRRRGPRPASGSKGPAPSGTGLRARRLPAAPEALAAVPGLSLPWVPGPGSNSAAPS